MIVYYAALLLFGIVGTLLAPDSNWYDVGAAIGGSLWIVFLTHFFFLSAPAIQHDWLSYLLVIGIPLMIIASALKLTDWLRNLAVVGLLLLAHAYGLAVAGMNG